MASRRLARLATAAGPTYLFVRRARFSRMSTDNPDLPDVVRASWHRFADAYEPLRGELYRYCRHLTRSPWDAEDLAQDTMSRAFASLGRLGSAPPNPRAWLFRVASNLWLDQVRRPAADDGARADNLRSTHRAA